MIRAYSCSSLRLSGSYFCVWAQGRFPRRLIQPESRSHKHLSVVWVRNDGRVGERDRLERTLEWVRERESGLTEDGWKAEDKLSFRQQSKTRVGGWTYFASEGTTDVSDRQVWRWKLAEDAACEKEGKRQVEEKEKRRGGRVHRFIIPLQTALLSDWQPSAPR